MSYYSVNKIPRHEAMAFLREVFEKGEADELNFVLFSTSGVHGTYSTIEECESGDTSDVTFLVVHPRIVRTSYGTVKPETPDDFAFLKRLRASSWEAVQKIGAKDAAPEPAQRPTNQEEP